MLKDVVIVLLVVVWVNFFGCNVKGQPQIVQNVIDWLQNGSGGIEKVEIPSEGIFNKSANMTSEHIDLEKLRDTFLDSIILEYQKS